MTLHERLRECLARLERCSGPGGTDDGAPRRREEIGHAETERQLRSYHRQVDGFAFCRREKRRWIPGIHRNASRDRADAGIAGRTNDVRHSALAGKLPRDCVLPAAAADDEHPHDCTLIN
jgi:hypothetical protein